MSTKTQATPTYDTYRLDFGYVSLPTGLRPVDLLYGVGLPRGRNLLSLGPGSLLLSIGAYGLNYNRWQLEQGLRACNIEFVYTPWQNKDGEYTDSAHCFWASLCGILAYGKKDN